MSDNKPFVQENRHPVSDSTTEGDDVGESTVGDGEGRGPLPRGPSVSPGTRIGVGPLRSNDGGFHLLYG